MLLRLGLFMALLLHRNTGKRRRTGALAIMVFCAVRFTDIGLHMLTLTNRTGIGPGLMFGFLFGVPAGSMRSTHAVSKRYPGTKSKNGSNGYSGFNKFFHFEFPPINYMASIWGFATITIPFKAKLTGIKAI
jgi:hypothetical protein